MQAVLFLQEAYNSCTYNFEEQIQFFYMNIKDRLMLCSQKDKYVGVDMKPGLVVSIHFYEHVLDE